jgi:alpha-ketoglutarate-dependent 2,4-dichlorophenoxyacetate dioxygenase
MAIEIRQVGPCFAGEATGVDLRKPLSDEDAQAIHAGMTEYGVLVFRGPRLSTQEQLNFTLALGTLERSAGTSLRGAEDQRVPLDFADVSNLDKDDQPWPREDRRRLFAIGNRLWHSDSSFKVVPAKYSLLHALSVTSRGGNTQFADMRAAYDALDDETRAEVAELVCEHSQIYSRQQLGFFDLTEAEKRRFAPVHQCMVRTLPESGRQSLYLSSHAGGIVGWPVPEARLFLRDLIEHATQPQFVHTHEWQVGDLVIWDNRQTMHRARSFPVDEKRDMRRTTLAGDGPTAAQAA